MRAFVTGGSGFVGRNLIQSLVADDIHVFALARSEAAARTVTDLGARVIHGSLDDQSALEEGCDGADIVFHSAAWVKNWGDPKEAERINVGGTQRLLDAAASKKIGRFVHVSTEAVLNGGTPLIDADETWPYPEPQKQPGPYPRTKAESERRVMAAAKAGLPACVVRPRLIWGAGDTAILPMAIAAVRAGRFMWLDGGRHSTSHVHVRNVVHALRLAADKGESGETYFVTDGMTHTYKEFFTAQLKTRGVNPGNRKLPISLAWPLASSCEAIWRTFGLSSVPPINRTEVAVVGLQMTVSDLKARRELGYAPIVDWDAGVAEMARESQ
ncbi:MAG: NAD-dependent epimerase/dehydratase family protein [Myxococcota bacterium]